MASFQIADLWQVGTDHRRPGLEDLVVNKSEIDNNSQWAIGKLEIGLWKHFSMTSATEVEVC
jgi:hypothetical protein